MAKRSPITVSSRRNAALARRLAPGANPFAGGSRDVPLQDGHRWQTRTFNTELHDNRHYQAVHELGWEPVTAADLPEGVTPESIGWQVAPDGGLVRGVRGQERLCKMDKSDYQVVQQRKTERNMQGIGSASKVRNSIAEAGAAALGGEAGEYLSKLDGQVIDTITGGSAA